MNEEYLFINDTDSLTRVCNQLTGSPWLAVDTEFERTRTYYPELCLLQLANPEITVIIDPLADIDMQAVYGLLYQHSITKVFHSARQDLEIFFHLHGRIPVPLYDTQLAAAAAGYDNSIGYAKLVEIMLGVTLDKEHTRIDWKRRPLKPSHLRYAADDVIYLGLIYLHLQAKINSPDKLATLHCQFNQLTDPQLYVPDPGNMWKKIRESKKMNGTALSLLQELAAWRELAARTANLPRKWILPDQSLLDIVKHTPLDDETLAHVRDLPRGIRQKYGKVLLTLVAKHSNKS